MVQDGVYDAFTQAGCNLNVFDYMNKYIHSKNAKRIREDFVQTAKNFQPDVVYLQIQHTNIIDARSIERVRALCPKAKIVNWTGDIRNTIPPTYKKIGQVSHLNLISSTGQLEMFRKQMSNVKYLQIGYNPKLYHPVDPVKLAYDAVFIAHYSVKENYPGSNDRLKACTLLRQRFGDRFALFGSGWPKASIDSKGSINQREVIKTYSRSVCTISISHYNDIDHYFSDRLLMCLASGRPCVALKFPKWESYFTNMCDLVIVNSIEEIPDAVQMLKNDPDLADYIGQSGAAKVQAEHTYFSRVKELLNMLGLK